MLLISGPPPSYNYIRVLDNKSGGGRAGEPTQAARTSPQSRTCKKVVIGVEVVVVVAVAVAVAAVAVVVVVVAVVSQNRSIVVEGFQAVVGAAAVIGIAGVAVAVATAVACVDDYDSDDDGLDDG